MITSPDFALALDDYRKMKDEIAAAMNNLEFWRVRSSYVSSYAYAYSYVAGVLTCDAYALERTSL